jgi:hypothetical protein
MGSSVAACGKEGMIGAVSAVTENGQVGLAFTSFHRVIYFFGSFASAASSISLFKCLTNSFVSSDVPSIPTKLDFYPSHLNDQILTLSFPKGASSLLSSV